MKSPAILVAGLLLLGPITTVLAGDLQLSSRSAGKLHQDQGIDLTARLAAQDPIVREKSSSDESYDSSAVAQRFAGVANRHDQLFEIYQADVQLLGDLDGDGYHHRLAVIFDVDVSYDDATVYAKIYLSREGEPWSQVFTTDLFQIYGDEVADTYEVETELLEGYPPGYYAVLVEIYSLDHAYMVASEVLDHHYLGRDVLLEDLYWDEPQVAAHGGVSVEYYEHGHGGGSMVALVLFFLAVQLVIAARGALASNPLKKSENYKKKGSPG